MISLVLRVKYVHATFEAVPFNGTGQLRPIYMMTTSRSELQRSPTSATAALFVLRHLAGLPLTPALTQESVPCWILGGGSAHGGTEKDAATRSASAEGRH